MQPRRYADGWEKYRMKPTTPLKLKRLMREHHIPQVRLCDVVTQADGKLLAESTVAQLVNRNIWPQRTPERRVRDQISAYLREQGVTDFELKTAFDLDETPDHLRHVPPSTQRNTAGDSAPDLDADAQPPENEMLTPQAKKHFQLFQDPFKDDVQGPDDVYLSTEQRYIKEAMFQTARNSGFLAVIGESGAGKTVLRRDLIERINRENLPINVMQPQTIDKGRLTAGSICDAIIADVSREAPKRSLEAKARQIQRLLAGSSRSGNSHVLMIEEAHDLNVQTLKYLKRFWELEDGFKRLLGIILIGQPELKDMLDIRINWDAREVINRCEIAELQPLNGDLDQYLEMKLKRVGKALDDLVDKEAFPAIRERLTFRRPNTRQVESQLYPQLINNLITKALNIAADIGDTRVTAETVGMV